MVAVLKVLFSITPSFKSQDPRVTTHAYVVPFYKNIDKSYCLEDEKFAYDINAHSGIL